MMVCLKARWPKSPPRLKDLLPGEVFRLTNDKQTVFMATRAPGADAHLCVWSAVELKTGELRALPAMACIEPLTGEFIED